jgi:transposase-like protein
MYTNKEDSQWQARRRYSADFKQELVLLCRQPGMSVASVARRHGINHNIVHRWIREHALCPARLRPDETAVPGFVAVPLPVKAPSVDAVIEVRISRGDLNLEVRWPANAAASAGDWLQGLLR